MSKSNENGNNQKHSPWLGERTQILLMVTLWFVLVFGGFYLAKQYIDQSFLTIQQTNAYNVQVLENRLDTLHRDMEDIKEALQGTDETISSSDSTQRMLNMKIEELDKQLKELERSLRILKEAPDASP